MPYKNICRNNFIKGKYELKLRLADNIKRNEKQLKIYVILYTKVFILSMIKTNFLLTK